MSRTFKILSSLATILIILGFSSVAFAQSPGAVYEGA